MTSLQYQLDLITVPLPKLEIIKFLIQHKYVDKLCRLCNKTWHTCHLHQVAYITRNFPSSNLKVCTPAMSGIEAVCSIYVVFSVALYAFYSKQKDKTFVVSSWVLLKWGGGLIGGFMHVENCNGRRKSGSSICLSHVVFYRKVKDLPS